MFNVPGIARIAHAALAEVRVMQGHPHVPWGLASEDDRAVVIGSVSYLIENPNAGEEDLFVALMHDSGYPPYSTAPPEVRLPFSITLGITRGVQNAASDPE